MLNLDKFKLVHKQKVDFYMSMIGTDASFLSRGTSVLKKMNEIEGKLNFLTTKIKISENNITDSSVHNMVLKLKSIKKLFDIRNAIKNEELVFDDKQINAHVERQEGTNVFIAIQNQLVKKKFLFILKILNLLQKEMSTTHITKERNIINEPEIIKNLFFEYNNERLAAMIAVYKSTLEISVYVKSLEDAINVIQNNDEYNTRHFILPYKLDTSKSVVQMKTVYKPQENESRSIVPIQDSSIKKAVRVNNSNIYILESNTKSNKENVAIHPLYKQCSDMVKISKRCTCAILKTAYTEKLKSKPKYPTMYQNFLDFLQATNDSTNINLYMIPCRENFSLDSGFDYTACPP